MPQKKHSARKIQILYLCDEDTDISITELLGDNHIECLVERDISEIVEKVIASQQRRKLILINTSPDRMLKALREIRQAVEIPIIVIMNSSDPEYEIMCFQRGADDCVLAERGNRVVLEHIFSLLKTAGLLRSELRTSSIKLELDTRSVWCGGTQVRLTPREFEMLEYFIRNSYKVLSRDSILVTLWGYDYDGDIRTVDTIVKQLRRKLGAAGNSIRSVYGIGYQFIPEEE